MNRSKKKDKSVGYAVTFFCLISIFGLPHMKVTAHSGDLKLQCVTLFVTKLWPCCVRLLSALCLCECVKSQKCLIQRAIEMNSGC